MKAWPIDPQIDMIDRDGRGGVFLESKRNGCQEKKPGKISQKGLA